MEGLSVHIEVDNLRSMIVWRRGMRCEDEAFSTLWLAFVEAVIERSLLTANLIIVEGLFYRSEQIAFLRERYPGIKTFLVRTSLEKCLIRNKERSALDERLYDDEVRDLFDLVRPSFLRPLDGETDDLNSKARYLLELILDDDGNADVRAGAQ